LRVYVDESLLNKAKEIASKASQFQEAMQKCPKREEKKKTEPPRGSVEAAQWANREGGRGKIA